MIQASLSSMAIFIMCNRLEELGGVQRVVRTLADAFVDKGAAVELVGIADSPDPHRIPSKHDVPEHKLFPGGPWWSALSQFAPGLIRLDGTRIERLRIITRRRAISKLRSLMQRHPGSAFIAMDVFSAELMASALTDKVVGIFQFHNSFNSVWSTRDGRRIARLASRLDRMVALSSVDARLFEAATGRKFDHINNPLPYDCAEPAADARQHLVVTMGRFTAQKSLSTLLDAWARVVREVPGWRLELIGSGPEEELLRERISRLGIEGSVAISPATNDVPSALAKASLFAMSSVYEGLPMVLIEAMAFGLPIAATDCSPGVRQLVHDRCCGLLSPVGDVEALATNLIKLIRDTDTRNAMSRMARAGVDEYRLDSVLEKWKSVIGEIREGKARA